MPHTRKARTVTADPDQLARRAARNAARKAVRDAERAERDAAREAERAAERAERVRRIVAAAPPLTEDQIARLRVLLAPTYARPGTTTTTAIEGTP